MGVVAITFFRYPELFKKENFKRFLLLKIIIIIELKKLNERKSLLPG